MIWDKIETLDRQNLRQLQLTRLQKTIRRVYEKVPFYRERFNTHGVKPEINSLDDLSKFPFTTKDDLRANYPFSMLAVDMKDVIRLHASSGTTGKPVVVGYTKKDIETWSDLMARIITQAGVTNEDIAQIAFSYGLFTGGFGLHYGMEKVGVTVTPASSGNTIKQLMLMKDFGTTVLVSTPSYALYMAEVAEKEGIDIKRDLKIRLGLFGGEPCSDLVRKEIEEQWGMKATVNYGLTEVMGPGVAGECAKGKGMHISEDHFIIEVIDPKTGEVLPEGAEGELVITTLMKDAFPVIRYRTRDIVTIETSPCECGRKTARISAIKGRSDDMLIIRGVNVFPSQIEAVLKEIPEASPHYQLVVSEKGHQKNLEVQIEPSQNFISNEYSIKELKDKIKKHLKSVLSIKTDVTILKPETIQRTAGKSKRIIYKENSL